MYVPLYFQVAKEIEEYIKLEKIDEGEKLGSERELAKKYHVSRSVIRKAMYILQDKGLLKLRSGEGAFVANPDTRFMEILKMILINQQETFLHSLEMREVLEKAIIIKVIPFLTTEKLDSLETILMQMDKSEDDPEKFIQLDRNFHERIASYIPNPLFLTLLQTFFSLEDNKSFLITTAFQDFFNGAQKEHQEILQALKTLDPEKAYKAIKTHMKEIRSDLLSLE